MTVQPGTIGLTQISGDVGKLIRIGQLLNGDGFADYQHAFLSIAGRTASGPLPDGSILEAEPGGARVGNVSEYSHIYWCENIAAKYGKALNDVVAAAQKYIGVPYSFLDYQAIAMHRLHIPGGRPLREYVESTKHMICSQLCDQAYFDANIQLFEDGRWQGYVTPLDLYTLDRALGASGCFK